MHSLAYIQSPAFGLATHLINDGLLTLETVKQIQQTTKAEDIPFVSYLVRQQIVSSDKILHVCARSFDLPIFDLSHLDKNWLSLLNLELIQRYHFIPLKKDALGFHIGVSDPTNKQVTEIVSFYTGVKTILWLVDETQLTRLLTTANTHLSKSHLTLSLSCELHDDSIHAIHDNTINYDEPLIRFVDHIIQQALDQSASDIHIEPYEKICRIRYRKDGLLHEVAEIPSKMATRLVTRLKVMSRLDIAERRLPQDGRFQIHNTDIRINTCPTIFGEKIVLRILNSAKLTFSLQELGLNEKQFHFLQATMHKPQGLILVTGPTGSGKTITLYSILSALNTTEKNISTVEDPIEVKLAGINQVNINPKIQFSFANALRTFLRQDPDIIMVGEIRDAETAEIAIQAAHTGHLVLSTLHTNNALDAISRLNTMGIPPYNLVSAVSLIVAQRLIRKLCTHCKQPESLPPHTLASLGLAANPIYKPIGCQYCLQGYDGRIGLYEFLPMTDILSQMILQQAARTTLEKQIQQEGFGTLRLSGLEKVNAGLTSLNELNRVLG